MGFKRKFTKELKKKTKGGFGLLSKPVSGGLDITKDIVGSGVDYAVTGGDAIGVDTAAGFGWNKAIKPVGNRLWDAMNYGGDLGTGIYTMGFTEPYVNEEGEYDIKDPFSLN